MSFEEMQSILQGILSSQQQFQSEMVETKAAADRAIQIAESNGRAIQSMLDQAATDRLQDEERMQQVQSTLDRAAQVADSNGRAIQAMLDQAVTDRLLQEERTQQHEERTRQHEERMIRLEAMSEGLINLSTSIDEDRPTILRLLNFNNNKLDLLLDRLPPQA
jgi:membrane-associated HD superfamily phosphohydrolase